MTNSDSRREIKIKLKELAQEICVSKDYYVGEDEREVYLRIPIKGTLHIKMSYNFTSYDYYDVSAYFKVGVMEYEPLIKTSGLGAKETLIELLDIISLLYNANNVFNL